MKAANSSQSFLGLRLSLNVTQTYAINFGHRAIPLCAGKVSPPPFLCGLDRFRSLGTSGTANETVRNWILTQHSAKAELVAIVTNFLWENHVRFLFNQLLPTTHKKEEEETARSRRPTAGSYYPLCCRETFEKGKQRNEKKNCLPDD